MPTGRASYRELALDGFATSWAGVHPFGGPGYCFGSEGGKILLTDGFGNRLSEVMTACRSGDVINGVAPLGDLLAVSTPSDVTVCKPGFLATVPAGAHDVVAGGGHFFAPCGPAGIIVITAGRHTPTWNVKSAAGRATPLVVYRACVIHRDGAPAALACAARGGGVATAWLEDGTLSGPIRTVTYPSLDVIDVCALPLPGRGSCAAALSRGGELIVLELTPGGRRPYAVRLGLLRGVAYKLLVRRGRLLVLTSEGIHLLSGSVAALAAAVEGRPVPARGAFVPVEAADLSAGHGEQLLALMGDDSVRVYDAAEVERLSDGASRESEILDLAWQNDESAQSSTAPLEAATA